MHETCTVPALAEVLEQQRLAETNGWRCPGAAVQGGLTQPGLSASATCSRWWSALCL